MVHMTSHYTSLRLPVSVFHVSFSLSHAHPPSILLLNCRNFRLSQFSSCLSINYDVCRLYRMWKWDEINQTPFMEITHGMKGVQRDEKGRPIENWIMLKVRIMMKLSVVVNVELIWRLYMEFVLEMICVQERSSYLKFKDLQFARKFLCCCFHLYTYYMERF